jgi:hypothetical protein
MMQTKVMNMRSICVLYGQSAVEFARNQLECEV